MDLDHGSRRLRVVELVLVLSVAFGRAVITSTYTWVNGARAPESPTLSMLASFFGELCAIAVLAYVLFRQGRSLGQIGLSFEWRDLPISIVVLQVGYVASTSFSTISQAVLSLLRGDDSLTNAPQNVEFLDTKITVAYALFVFINPFCEELICRAYLMSEVKHLTGSASAAVILSVLFQTSYHLYQGLFSASVVAVMFLVFSLYYAKWKRITPVILAHLYVDLLAMIAHGKL